MGELQVPRFVKWAGGKHQLLEQLEPLFPKKFNSYFEPFVGGGAVAFHILQKFKPKKVVLSDINEELVNSYNIIKTDVERLIIELKQHKEYHSADTKGYFYEIRKVNPCDLPELERAARFIYLNRTCFNGLYRVNSKGEFNVPIGAYKNPDIIQEEKLRVISGLLKKVTIKCTSFEKVLDLIKKNDFVYFDPPYYPLKKGKSFTAYQKDSFLEKEQEKLAEVFKKLSQKGCCCMESNSDTKFIRELYSKNKIKVVKARRLINSKSEGRGEINEVVIRNYI